LRTKKGNGGNHEREQRGAKKGSQKKKGTLGGRASEDLPGKGDPMRKNGEGKGVVRLEASIKDRKGDMGSEKTNSQEGKGRESVLRVTGERNKENARAKTISLTLENGKCSLSPIKGKEKHRRG